MIIGCFSGICGYYRFSLMKRLERLQDLQAAFRKISTRQIVVDRPLAALQIPKLSNSDQM